MRSMTGDHHLAPVVMSKASASVLEQKKMGLLPDAVTAAYSKLQQAIVNSFDGQPPALVSVA